MGFGFMKALAGMVHPRRGVLAFRLETWNDGAEGSIWTRRVLEEVKVVGVETAGGMVRVTCDCEKFSPLARGEKPPLYLPRISVKRGPEGESCAVEFRRMA